MLQKNWPEEKQHRQVVVSKMQETAAFEPTTVVYL